VSDAIKCEEWRANEKGRKCECSGTQKRGRVCVREKGNGKKEEGRQVEENGRVLVSRGSNVAMGEAARTESDTVRVGSKKGGFVGEVRENVVCGRGEESSRRGEERRVQGEESSMKDER
jgi:hypothetical protein